jgi:hypothetical protein
MLAVMSSDIIARPRPWPDAAAGGGGLALRNALLPV